MFDLSCVLGFPDLVCALCSQGNLESQMCLAMDTVEQVVIDPQTQFLCLLYLVWEWSQGR